MSVILLLIKAALDECFLSKKRSAICRAFEDYRALSPIALGMVMKFVLTLGKPGVWAWGCGELDKRQIDVVHYEKLLDRAVQTVLELVDEKASAAFRI